MKLTKHDVLFLHAALWHLSLTTSLGLDVQDKLNDMLETFSDCLLSGDDQEETDGDLVLDDSSDDESDDELDDYAEDSQETEVDLWISDTILDDLPPAKVKSADGTTTSLEFEMGQGSDDPSVDVILDAEIINNVQAIKLSNDMLHVWSPESDWLEFSFVRKLPKTWARHLEVDTIYGIIKDDDNDSTDDESEDE